MCKKREDSENITQKQTTCSYLFTALLPYWVILTLSPLLRIGCICNSWYLTTHEIFIFVQMRMEWIAIVCCILWFGVGCSLCSLLFSKFSKFEPFYALTLVQTLVYVLTVVSKTIDIIIITSIYLPILSSHFNKIIFSLVPNIP